MAGKCHIAAYKWGGGRRNAYKTAAGKSEGKTSFVIYTIM
jgi:hypothetical protein